jgi:Ca2+-binding EF-hand superfamily protein
MMRQRLLTLSNHSEEEFTLRKIFKDFDLNGNGSIAIDELGAMLAKLGICVDRKYIYAMLKKLDTNDSGVLEFKEFANLVLYDPYK